MKRHNQKLNKKVNFVAMIDTKEYIHLKKVIKSSKLTRRAWLMKVSKYE